MKKRILLLLLTAAFLFPQPIYALSWPEVSAECALLADGETGRVLFEKNAHEKSLIASTTKIITALVVLEHCDLTDKVEILPEYTGIEGSSFYLKAGEVLTVKELLQGLLLESGNDAAVALACFTAGSVENFAVLMNEKACELGAVESHFSNPNGLDGEEHYSTAYDLMLITRAALENEIFAEIVSTRETTAAGRSLRNHNKLLWELTGCCGVKTGYTMAAGRILVSACKRNGLYAICVTISDPDDWADHKNLYESFFSGFSDICVIEEGSSVSTVPVVGGTEESVPLNAACCTVMTAQEDEIITQIYVPQFVYAPVLAGQVIGRVEILRNGEVIETRLLTADHRIDLSEQNKLTFWERLTCYLLTRLS